MSYHINLNEYTCPSCNAIYIPYEKNMACPSCQKIEGNIPEEYLDFISRLISSLKVNKTRGGRYIAMAWYVGSYCDYIQDVIFHVFDAIDREEPKDVEVFITKYLDSLRWDTDAPYRKDYIHKIVSKIYARREELKISLWARLLSKIMP